MKAVSCVTQYLPVNELVFEKLRSLDVAFACDSGLGGVFSLSFIKFDEIKSEYHFKVTNPGWEEEKVVSSSDLESKILWQCKMPVDFYIESIDGDSIVGACINESTEADFERLRFSNVGSYNSLDFAGGVISHGNFTGWEAVSSKVE
jgi:hypothetical protein